MYHGIINGQITDFTKYGWGHSYPEAVAQTAHDAEVKTVVLFHHDPTSSDEAIKKMEETTQRLIKDLGGKSKVVAASEGMTLSV